MNNKARHKLKKKIFLIQLSAFLIGVVLTGLILLSIKLYGKPVEEAKRIYAIIIVGSIITPVMTGWILAMYATSLGRIYDKERFKLKHLKEDMYYQRFCELIWSQDFEGAKDYYNNFIKGSYRIICHGILLGAVFVSGADKDWESKASQRMIEIGTR